MSELRLAPGADDFIWGCGIEDTFVPQTRRGHRALDEYELIGHYAHWREDLELARELGVGALRWGVPWYRVQPRPDAFDWSWTDQVVPYMVEQLGITPIIDLMHYGCPLWLEREFDNPRYPELVAAYAGAFAERYVGLVRWYTPLNEPLVNAEWCGLRGRWPPYLRGQRGYVWLVLQLVEGILRTVGALRAARPDSIMVHVEATGLTRSARPDLAPLAREDQLRRFLVYDLLTGRVTPEHPLFAWLVWSGASPDVLRGFAERAIGLDVLGLNFYPQWSTESLIVDAQGRLVRRKTQRDGEAFLELLRTYFERYRVPMMITETSAVGTDEVRSAWLRKSLSAIKQARQESVPILGYTWFPLFTMFEWHYRFGSQPKDTYLLQLGLYRLAPSPRWQATPLVDEFKQAIREPLARIDTLNKRVETPVRSRSAQ